MRRTNSVTDGTKVRPVDGQVGLFDLPSATDARDEAIARVDLHADAKWKDTALEAVRELCESRPSFIVDDVWETGLPKPREARALGAVMIRAAKLGYCVATGEYRKSSQVQCHTNLRTIWKSLLYRSTLLKVSNG